MIFHAELSADDVITSSTGGMTAARRVLSNDRMVLWLDRHHHLEAMRQLYMEDDIGWIQERVLVGPVVPGDRLTNNKA